MDGSCGKGALQKANDCIKSLGQSWGAKPLFDEFWRRGELALMFGPAGAGKSVLAVQIADALGRGCDMEGFQMPAWRQKVLYVDLALSDRQFVERYSYFSKNARLPKRWKFPENLYRARPKDPKHLCEWLEGAVRENSIDAVIIDDLSAVKQTHDGIRETLAVMRRLKKLCDESGVAIMAIASCDAPQSGRSVRVGDMGRSRILCSVADSVFSLGPSPVHAGEQCLIQHRVRQARLWWNERNAPFGNVDRLETGLLGFRFDKRFHPYIDGATFDLIIRIRAKRKAGQTFKYIAAELGISKTRAFVLNGKWIPSMDEQDDDEDELDDDEPATTTECGSRTAEFDGNDESRFSNAINITPLQPASEQADPPTIDPHSALRSPQLLGPERVSVYDLQRGFSRDGDEIFIEREDRDTGRPQVWYRFDRRGNKVKFVRDGLGITSTRLGPTEFL